MDRPDPSECHDYYHRYIDLVPDGDIADILAAQIEETGRVLAEIPEERGSFRYAPGKWSIKEVVGHLADTERVFGLRALCFARRDPAPLPSMEQDDWVRAAGFDARTLVDLARELRLVRLSHLGLFRSFDLDPDIATRRGMASGCSFTVRCIPYILAGHERHHVGVLKERYLPA